MWSMVIAKPLGIIAGELTKLIAKEMDVKPENAARAAQVVGGLVSAGTDLAVSAALLDPAGAITSPGTGYITSELFDPNGPFGVFADHSAAPGLPPARA